LTVQDNTDIVERKTMLLRGRKELAEMESTFETRWNKVRGNVR
jgi:hypothetical protein